MKKILFSLFMLFVLTSSVSASEELPRLKIQQIAEGIYLHTSFKVVDGFGLVDSNGLVVLIHDDAYVVDTPWSAEDTKTLLGWIKEKDLHIKGSISTHFHEDRTAGIEFLNSQSIPTYASRLTNQLLKKAGRAQAINTFENGDFWMLKDKIGIFYPGAGHTQDNVVVWLPEERVLFGGCFVRAKEATNLGNVSDAVIAAWSESAKKLESKYRNARFVVPGHGEVGDVSLLKHTRDLAILMSSQSK